MEQVASVPVLAAAFQLAAAGKGERAAVCRFRSELDAELGALVRELSCGTWIPGPFERFTVRDPKLRVIHAAPFRDRVVHHALMLVAGPVLERSAAAHSCACRAGRGNLAAVWIATRAARRYPHYLKLDVRRYFDSVPHEVLIRLLHGRFKDRALLAVLERIIGSFSTEPGRGLPIGTLTSQYFANFFLDGMDHWLKGTLRIPAAVRYMDDFVVWHDDFAELMRVHTAVAEWLEKERGLTLKESAGPRPCAEGIPFLGFRILPGRVLLARASRRRFAARLRGYEASCAEGTMSPAELQRRVSALLAFTDNARCLAWRRRVTSTGFSA